MHCRPPQTVLTVTAVPSDGVIAVLQLQNNSEYCGVNTTPLSNPFPRAIMATARISFQKATLIIRVHAISTCSCYGIHSAKLLVCLNQVDQCKMVTLQSFSGLLCLVVLYSLACKQGTSHCDSSFDHPPSNCCRTTFTLLLLLCRLLRASLRLQLLQVCYQFVAFQQLGIQRGYQLIVLLKLHTHFLHLRIQCRWHIILAGQIQLGAEWVVAAQPALDAHISSTGSSCACVQHASLTSRMYTLAMQ